MRSNLKIVNTNLTDSSTPENELIDRMNSYLNKTGFKSEQIAERIGANISEFNAWLLNQATSRSVKREAERFLDIELTWWDTLELAPLKFTETSIYKQIQQTCDFTRQRKLISMLMAHPGYGKTFSLKSYADKNDNTFVIDASLISKSSSDIIKQLQLSIEKKTGHHFYYKTLSLERRSKEIIEYLNADLHPQRSWFYEEDSIPSPANFPLIIIDQGDKISIPAIDLLTTLWDKIRVGITLVGTEHLGELLERDKSWHQQFDTRIRISMDLPKPTFEDFSNILDLNWYKLTENIKKKFYTVCEGNFRHLETINFHCRELLRQEENKGRFLEEEDIDYLKIFLRARNR